MTKRLFIRIHKQNKLYFEWIILNEAGQSLNIPGSALSSLVANEKKWAVIVLVPATDVFITRVQLPKMSKKNRQAAIPFALEEQLTEDISKLHFSVGNPIDQRTFPVAITKTEMLLTWRKLVHDFIKLPDLRVECIIPESLVLPWKANEWTVCLDKSKVLVKLDKQIGFGLDVTLIWLQMHLLLTRNETPLPTKIVFINIVPPAEIIALLDKNKILIENQTQPENLFMTMAQHYDQHSIISLLDRDLTKHIFIQKFQPPIAMLLISLCTLTLLISSFFQLNLLNNQQRQLLNHMRKEMNTLVSSSTLKNQNTLGYRHLLKEIRKEKTGNLFWQGLKSIGPTLQSMSSIKLVKIHFENKQLILTLTNEKGVISEMNKQLKKTSFSYDIKVNQDNQVNIILQEKQL